MNQEVMALYKREKLSPFSGCLSAIVQIILLFSVFYLVRQPLTYMKKVDPEVIGKLQEVVQENGKSSNYQEIAIINYINNLEAGNQEAVSQDGNNEQTEKSQEDNNEDNNSNEEKININNYRDQVYINMDFIGLDLSKVPLENLEDLKVLVIPALYVISSFISIRISTNATKKKKDKNLIGDGKEEQEEYDPMEQANKSMSLFMPFMSISIACIAPLGLALYWLVNNILMIAERLILNKFLKDDKEEAKTDA